MTFQYSPSGHNFYASDLVYSSLPADLMSISDAEVSKALSRPIGHDFTVGAGGLVVLIAPVVLPPEAPSSVSPAQARLALLGVGLLDQVEAIVAAADAPTQIAWRSATVIERNSPTVAALAGALGLTDAQLDDLFTTAAGIFV